MSPGREHTAVMLVPPNIRHLLAVDRHPDREMGPKVRCPLHNQAPDFPGKSGTHFADPLARLRNSAGSEDCQNESENKKNPGDEIPPHGRFLSSTVLPQHLNFFSFPFRNSLVYRVSAFQLRHSKLGVFSVLCPLSSVLCPLSSAVSSTPGHLSLFSA